MVVRRELTLQLVKLSPQEGYGFSVPGGGLDGENPKIVFVLRIVLLVNNEPTVPRPLRRHIRDVIPQQRFILPASGGGFLKEIVDSETLTRREDNAFTLGRPRRRQVVRSVVASEPRLCS